MINDSIIGLTDTAELRYLEKLANALPPKSLMVEVGTFVGRTAHALASTRPDCLLLVIDPFDADLKSWFKGSNIRGDLTKWCGENQLDFFWKNMNDCRNVEAIVGLSPLRNQFDDCADLVFIDAAHHYDAIAADIAYWSKYVPNPSALCGHDYCDEFSDVKRAVDEFAMRVHGTVYVEPGTTIWRVM